MAKIFSLTGGIGTGKSTVCSIFSEMGAAISDMDKIAHEIVMPGKPAYNDIVNWLGKDILLDDGNGLDRQKMAGIVFQDAGARKRLESITHPRIIQQAQNEIASAIGANYPLIIIDVPLLFETGLEKIFNPVILVVADDEIRIQRVIKRDGWSEKEIRARINSQMPQDEKIQKADYIIKNNSNIDALKNEVKTLWHTILNLQ